MIPVKTAAIEAALYRARPSGWEFTCYLLTSSFIYRALYSDIINFLWGYVFNIVVLRYTVNILLNKRMCVSVCVCMCVCVCVCVCVCMCVCVCCIMSKARFPFKHTQRKLRKRKTQALALATNAVIDLFVEMYTKQRMHCCLSYTNENVAINIGV